MASYQQQLKNNHKLPSFIRDDGAKWLMIPSKIILEGLGVWPEKQNNITRVIHFVFITSLTLTITGQILFIRSESNLGSRAFAISWIIVSIESIIRRLLCYFRRERLNKVLSNVYFEFWPSTKMGEKLHQEISKESWYLLLYCSAYMFSAFLCIVQANLLPILHDNLPLQTMYPFNLNQNPYYAFLYVWEGFLGMELAFNVCGLDLFFVSLLFNCATQFKLLQSNLREECKMENDPKAVRKVIIVCIERHCRLIRCCQEIECIFSFFILIQYMTSIMTVCLSSFVVTVVPTAVGTSLTYLMGHVCEIFIYCYMGENLIIQSGELSNAAFECDWQLKSTGQDVQKSLIMIMVRSQKPVRISAGGFGYLSLSSFMKLAQFSFSVFTVLQKMNTQRDI